MTMDTAIATKNQPFQKPNADGSVPMTPVFPWPGSERLSPAKKGYGIANPLDGVNDRNQAEWWRFQVGYWKFTRDLVTGNLTLPKATSLGYMKQGLTDAGEPILSVGNTLLWNQTASDTDLYAGGAPTPRDYVFPILSMGFSFGRPFTVPTPPLAADAKNFLGWVNHYADLAVEILMQELAVNVKFQDQACNYTMGLSNFYSPVASQFGGSTPRIGGGFGPVAMLPINRGPIWAGAKDESNQATITLSTGGANLTIGQEAGFPTTADLYVPLTFIGYGDCTPWCSPVCAPSAAEIAGEMIKQLMASGASPAQIAAVMQAMQGKAPA